ncbi:MAG: hypothetical protein JO262_08595 [Solirubrobacterales bacterium]|nr:hypothetical protein [Solirubrobacterales bacterium]
MAAHEPGPVAGAPAVAHERPVRLFLRGRGQRDPGLQIDELAVAMLSLVPCSLFGSFGSKTAIAL